MKYKVGVFMVVKFDLKNLLKNLAVPLLVGLVSGFLTRNAVTIFNETVNKPFFMPPGWLFPVVWTILYTIMGISTYLINTTKTDKNKKLAYILYFTQLAFNFIWPFIFFNLEMYLFAFIWIIILWILIIATTLEFYKINKAAAFLMIPYIIWVTFASVLNFSIYLLN